MNEATIRTDHTDPTTIAAAVAPDNTPEVETTVEDESVVTTIRRDSLGGLRATITDYLRAIRVADETARLVTSEHNEHP